MAARSAPSTRPLAASIRALGASRDAALLVDPAGVILFANQAWERLARATGGGPACLASALVGTAWLDHVAGEEPRRRHGLLLERARALRAPGAVVQLAECNDASTARLVATRLEPVFAAPGAIAGVAIVHRVARERPIAEVYPPVPLDGRDLGAGEAGPVQCSCCRRTRRPGDADEWEFVPELVLVPPVATRFAYCALCLALHPPEGGAPA